MRVGSRHARRFDRAAMIAPRLDRPRHLRRPRLGGGQEARTPSATWSAACWACRAARTRSPTTWGEGLVVRGAALLLPRDPGLEARDPDRARRRGRRARSTPTSAAARSSTGTTASQIEPRAGARPLPLHGRDRDPCGRRSRRSSGLRARLLPLPPGAAGESSPGSSAPRRAQPRPAARRTRSPRTAAPRRRSRARGRSRGSRTRPAPGPASCSA